MTVRELHDQAMCIADDARLLRTQGRKEESRERYAAAFGREKDAALLAVSQQAGPTTRAVLFRSAGTMALNSNNWIQAEQMVAMGLSAGDAPADIAEELRDLLEQIHFARHLELKGVTLEPNQLQISLSGPGVGYGFASVDAVIRRIDVLETLLLRCASRQGGEPFTERGNWSKKYSNQFLPYLSVPRAASFAFTLQLGSIHEMALPPDGNVEPVLEDLFANIDHINQGNLEALRSSIRDEKYFNNFVALLKELAPDGKEVSQVGFTRVVQGNLKFAQITRRRGDFAPPPAQSMLPVNSEIRPVQVTGTLSRTNASNSSVRLRTQEGKSVTFFLTDGLSDVVKNYCETEVIASGYERQAENGRKKLYLTSIDPAN